MLICLAFIFQTIFIVLANEQNVKFLSDTVKVFQFKKDPNRNLEFEFQYQVENGELFMGRTFLLTEELDTYTKQAPNGTYYSANQYVFLMRGDHNKFYWTEFFEDDVRKPESFSKYVRSVEIKPWGDHLAHFMDNNVDYLIFGDGHVLRIGYPPSWDFENVCFEKSKTDDQRFYYTILSTNNRKRFEGTVIVEKENEYTRLRQFADHAAFRAKFSKTELDSSSFCKSIEKVPLQEALPEEKHHYSLQTDYVEAARKSPITAPLYAELKTL